MKLLVSEGVPATFVPIDATGIGHAPRLADLFDASRAPEEVDISRVFDDRYNIVVREAQQ
jgi:hypothetical protein